MMASGRLGRTAWRIHAELTKLGFIVSDLKCVCRCGPAGSIMMNDRREVRLECHDPIGTFRHPSLSVNSRAAKHQMTSRLLAQYPGIR